MLMLQGSALPSAPPTSLLSQWPCGQQEEGSEHQYAGLRPSGAGNLAQSQTPSTVSGGISRGGIPVYIENVPQSLTCSEVWL